MRHPQHLHRLYHHPRWNSVYCIYCLPRPRCFGAGGGRSAATSRGGKGTPQGSRCADQATLGVPSGRPQNYRNLPRRGRCSPKSGGPSAASAAAAADGTPSGRVAARDKVLSAAVVGGYRCELQWQFRRRHCQCQCARAQRDDGGSSGQNRYKRTAAAGTKERRGEKSSDISIFDVWHIAQEYDISARNLAYQCRLAYQPGF